LTAAEQEFSLPPSTLAYKILCSGFVARPFDPASRLRVMGLHALATVATIRRHLKKGFELRSIERAGRGFRVDLLFQSPLGKIRLSEVKSARIIRPIHMIQGALYWRPNNGIDEIAISNRETDLILTSRYVVQVAEKAQSTLELLQSDPETAQTTYTPNSECRYCSNSTCPWLPLANSLDPSNTNRR
jgi:hypothetical protein